MARSPKKARGFKPAKKSARRTTDSKKSKEVAPQKVEGDLEILEDEVEKRGIQIESAIVYVTTLSLIIGLFWAMAALGKHYKAGPFKGMYEGPDVTHFKDPGVAAYSLRVREEK